MYWWWAGLVNLHQVPRFNSSTSTIKVCNAIGQDLNLRMSVRNYPPDNPVLAQIDNSFLGFRQGRLAKLRHQ